MLETARRVLRPLTVADAPFILRLVTQASWLHFIGDKGVHDVASAERYLLDGPMAMQARHGYALQLVALRALRDLTRVLAIATPDNERSATLLARLGFVPEGTLDAGALRLFVNAQPGVLQ